MEETSRSGVFPSKAMVARMLLFFLICLNLWLITWVDFIVWLIVVITITRIHAFLIGIYDWKRLSIFYQAFPPTYSDSQNFFDDLTYCFGFVYLFWSRVLHFSYAETDNPILLSIGCGLFVYFAVSVVFVFLKYYFWPRKRQRDAVRHQNIIKAVIFRDHVLETNATLYESYGEDYKTREAMYSLIYDAAFKDYEEKIRKA